MLHWAATQNYWQSNSNTHWAPGPQSLRKSRSLILQELVKQRLSSPHPASNFYRTLQSWMLRLQEQVLLKQYRQGGSGQSPTPPSIGQDRSTRWCLISWALGWAHLWSQIGRCWDQHPWSLANHCSTRSTRILVQRFDCLWDWHPSS